MNRTDDGRKLDATLRLVGEREGKSLKLLGRYAKGETGGAFRVVDDCGRTFAFKLSRRQGLERAAATTEVLRRTGYPAPAYIAIGPVDGDSWYGLLEEMPGQPIRRLNEALVDQILALVEMQAGRAFLPIDERTVIDTLLLGGEGYALHKTLRTYSSATRELLKQVIAIAERGAALDFPSLDIVHYDFHIGNMLAVDRWISGVVDWEGTRSGDRAFDLATLLFYEAHNKAIEKRLWGALLDITDLDHAAVYLAHMMLRQVEWSARHHGAFTVHRFLMRSKSLLETLGRMA